MKLNRLLQQERERRGWSRTVVARKLNTTPSTIAAWEQGLCTPSPSFQELLRVLFDLNASTFNIQEDVPQGIGNTGAVFLLVPRQQTTALFPDESQGSSRSDARVFDPMFPPFPMSFHEFVGRDALLQQMKAQLLTTSALALYGLPGIGKTAVVLALAHDPEVNARFDGGILWAGLGPHPQIPKVLNHWSSLLGMTPPMIKMKDNLETWKMRLQEAIGQRRMLLVLDDVWQGEIIEDLRVGGPHCAYLVTTRFASIATQVAAERALLIHELEEADGIRLLTRFAPQLNYLEPNAVISLVRIVGGLPLALTLMGKYLGRQAYSGSLRRLKSATKQLYNAEQRLNLSTPRTPLNYPPSSSSRTTISIQSVLAVSNQQLSSHDRQVFSMLSVFPSKPASFTANAAMIVARTSMEALYRLCDAGLLEYREEERYMLHPVVADYARSQLRGTDAAIRLIEYTLDLLLEHAANPVLLERESAITLAALEWAREIEQNEALIRGVCLFIPLLSFYGWYSLAERLLQQACTVAKHIDDLSNLAQLLGYSGTIAYEQGDYLRGEAYCQEGLTLARMLGDRKLISYLLTELGMIAHEQGAYAQAEAYCQEGLPLAREHGDRKQSSKLLRVLGAVAKKRGNYQEATSFSQEGLALAQALGDRDLMSLLLLLLGGIAHERGDEEQAETYYQQALNFARQLGHRERISVLLCNLGVVADARGRYRQAEMYLYEGLAIAQALKHRERISLLLLNLGVVIGRQGHDKQAEMYYQESLAIARALGHRERISLLLLNLGEESTQQQNYQEAEVYYQEGLAIARMLGHRERISDLLLHLGILATKQSQLELATTYLTEGLNYAHILEHPQLLCRLLNAQGDLHLEEQQLQAAKHDFQQVLSLVPPQHATLIASAHYGLARVAAAHGHLDEAYRLAHESLKTFETQGHRQRHAVKVFLKNQILSIDAKQLSSPRGKKIYERDVSEQ